MVNNKGILSQEEITKLLNLNDGDANETEYPKLVTDKMKRKQLLFFLRNGNDTSLKINDNINDSDLIALIKTIDVSKLKLPNENLSNENYLTKEKFSKILSEIIFRIENGEKPDLDQILQDLDYRNLSGAIVLT